MREPSLPDFAAIEQRIVDELQTGIATVGEQYAGRPLAAIVLWADPYNGAYELHVDTHERNVAGARARNAKLLARLPALAAYEDAWKTAMTVARRTEALPFDPRYGEFVSSDDPVHTFDIELTELVRSPRYAELNVGGEDGWLEGHVRFVIARAIARLVEGRAFDALARGPQLYVGYAYTDSSDAIMVAIVGDGA